METNKYIQALAKIKILLNSYYQKLGREVVEDTFNEMKDLIEEIDDVLSRVQIPARFFVADKLRKEQK